MGPLSIDQLRVFQVVAEEGSFSAAARRLHRAQSAVSYAIATLEEQLGVPLFTRGGRAPTLTAAGGALLSDVGAITFHVEQLQARARGIASGVEAQLALVVDVLYPVSTLVVAIQELHAAFPLVSLVVQTEVLGAVAQQVLDGKCRIGIGCQLPRFPEGLQRWPLGAVALVPAVAPQHPLAHLRGLIPTAVLREHVQLVLTDRSRLTEGVDLGVLSTRTWRLADLSTKHAFLRAGFGWGSMPEHLIHEDLESGRLVRIQPAEWPEPWYRVPIQALCRADDQPGPAGRWLLTHLGARLDQQPL